MCPKAAQGRHLGRQKKGAPLPDEEDEDDDEALDAEAGSALFGRRDGRRLPSPSQASESQMSSVAPLHSFIDKRASRRRAAFAALQVLAHTARAVLF